MLMVSEILGDLSANYSNTFINLMLMAQIIKCEIYSNQPTYLLDALTNLNLILPTLLESES